MSKHKGPPKRPTSGLLGDLESIRSLLEEDQEASREAADDQGPEPRPPEVSQGEGAEEDEDVPLLEDVVHGGVSVNETFLAGQGDFEEDSGLGSGLDEETFRALLSDEWRESVRELLDQARAAIEEHPTEWTPEHTDELNEALKVRIDETLQSWLQKVVRERIDELRRELLSAVSQHIRATVEAQLKPTSTHEDPDGE